MADDFADVIRSKHKRQRTPWTGFHSMLLIGIVSFFIFWICLLSKVQYISYVLQCGYGGCGTGNGIMGQMGCTGHVIPFHV